MDPLCHCHHICASTQSVVVLYALKTFLSRPHIRGIFTRFAVCFANCIPTYLRFISVLRTSFTGLGRHHERYFRSNSRVLSTAQLHALLHFHLRPIYHLFCVVSFRNLILRRTSRLDAFSAYSFRTQLLSAALGRTTDSPLVRPSRSSRTRDSSPQISYAHAG